MDDYRFLRVSVKIFNVLAWLSVVFGIAITVILVLGGKGPDAPRAAGLVGILLGAVYFLMFKTVSAVIRLLLEIASKVKS